MNKRNYQKELEKIIEENQKAGRVPRLFLHSCCAPCSSYVLEYLSQYFQITDFFYNPNISPKEEYDKRTRELQRLIAEMPFLHKPEFVEGRYDPQEFFQMAKGLEKCRKGESGASNVTVSGWKKRRKWRPGAVMIILPLPLPSAL